MLDNCSFTQNFNKSFKKEFYLQSTVEVAKQLLGNVLVKKTEKDEYICAKIVEVEAYLDTGDLSSHSAPGMTKRNQAMFEDGGIIYIYKIYGIHYCLNIVTENANKGCAVLLRAAEPLLGIDLMRQNRNSQDIKSLCKGPGNLAKAFDFDISQNQKSLLTPELFIQENSECEKNDLVVSKRIGITKSSDLDLRFYLKDNPFVSGPKNARQATQ